MDENRAREIFREELASLFGKDHFTLSTHMQLLDGRNIRTGRTTGTMIGTATDQKIGFFGTTPVVQQAAPTTLANVITVLQTLGLTL